MSRIIDMGYAESRLVRNLPLYDMDLGLTHCQGMERLKGAYAFKSQLQ